MGLISDKIESYNFVIIVKVRDEIGSYNELGQ